MMEADPGSFTHLNEPELSEGALPDGTRLPFATRFAELHDYFVPDVRDTLRSLGVHEATPKQVKCNQKKMIEKLGAGDSRFQTEWDANFWSSKP